MSVPCRSAYQRWGKRTTDVVLVTLLAPVWVPVAGLMALLVRIGMGSPVLFRQERPGLGGRPFRILKFRTMTDARDASGGLLPDGDRLTAVGRLLRATSLDELPELLNVLRGDMSLVGPRPLLMRYLSRYSPDQARRHEVRPGVTGWAQVNGRNLLTWEEKFAHDVWYVDHCSLGLDLRILFKTVIDVFRRRGIAAEGHKTMPEFVGRSGERSGEGS